MKACSRSSYALRFRACTRTNPATTVARLRRADFSRGTLRTAAAVGRTMGSPEELHVVLGVASCGRQYATGKLDFSDLRNASQFVVEEFENNSMGRIEDILEKRLANVDPKMRTKIEAEARKRLAKKYEAISPPEEQDERYLFVRGLDWSCDSKTLERMFSPFGKVVGARAFFDPKTGNPKSCGVVFFSDKAKARAALQDMNNKIVNNRSIGVVVADKSRLRGLSFAPEFDLLQTL